MADEKKKTTRKKKEETAAEELEAPVVSEEVQAEAGEVEAEPVPEEPAAEAEPAAEPEPEPEAAPEPEPAGETLAEAEPAADVEAEAAGAEARAAQPQPETKKKKRKHVPRSQRRQRPKNRVGATERKPLTRLPKPEGERGRTQERRGVVVSAAMDKTIVVRVDAVRAHPKYKKVIRRSKKFHAHDEQNSASIGDVVRIVETRPLSKTKRWRLAEVLEVAK